MGKAILSIMLLAGLAIACLVIFDSHFVAVGAVIVISLIALLVPLTLICRGRKPRK